MIKTKILAGLFAMLATLAVSVAPALAQFESTHPSGESVATSATFASSATFEAGGGTTECKGASSGANEAKAEFKVRKEDASQGQVKAGGHLNIKVIKWGACKSKTSVAGVKEIPTEVSSCELQIKQKATKEPGNGIGFGGIVTGCTVMVAEVVGAKCEIKVPPESNQTLSQVNFENNAANLLITPEVEGIKDAVSTGCATAGIKAVSNGKFKGELTAPEVKTV